MSKVVLCVAGAILVRQFDMMSCIFRDRHNTLATSIVISRGRRSTLDVSCWPVLDGASALYSVSAFPRLVCWWPVPLAGAGCRCWWPVPDAGCRKTKNVYHVKGTRVTRGMKQHDGEKRESKPVLRRHVSKRCSVQKTRPATCKE